MLWDGSRRELKEEEIFMKTKSLLFISCLTAGALIASPSFGKPAKKSTGMSHYKAKRVAPHTTQVMRNGHHNQNISPRMGSTRYYGGTRYSGTRSYAARQYSGTRYYGGTRNYGNYYGGGTGYYYGGSAYPSYSYYSGSPYSNWGYGTSGYYPYSYYGGGYPYSGYNNYYSYYRPTSYYTPTYGYNGSIVASVQRRLGQLGYYHGVVDGVIGPQTRGAIAAFESRNGLSVDGTISRPLLDTLGLA
jgi:Putative peptidoglycan binding domain